MSDQELSPLEFASDVMQRHGATRIVFKLLANNDNSKQQVYFGGDFDVLRLIPHGDLVSEISSRDGPIFKASLNLSWIDVFSEADPAPAPGAQLIFYPRYPEVRFSGFLKNCSRAPSLLMQPPTSQQRQERELTPRCLVLGLVPNGSVLAYVAAWGSDMALDATHRINAGQVENIASVFHELKLQTADSRSRLLQRLTEIYQGGEVQSCRLGRDGKRQAYTARNAAGYTLESLFGIIPNGIAEPDFLGWELKCHGRGPVTLMTPEPDSGSYRDDLGQFLQTYGKCGVERRDFTGKHLIGVRNIKTGLTLRMEGYDPAKNEVTDTSGGLVLRDDQGNIAAGWTYNKLLTHWSKKHAETAYIKYTSIEANDLKHFTFGPEILLCQGTGVGSFLRAMYTSEIYYDPGINMKRINEHWTPKKRNQFRVGWKNIGALYAKTDNILLPII